MGLDEFGASFIRWSVNNFLKEKMQCPNHP